MIVRDTNVVSGAWDQPSAHVTDGLSRQEENDLHLTAISQAGLLFGMAVLPASKRRRVKEQALEDLLDNVFADRILPFDGKATRSSAVLFASARSCGLAVKSADGQIAAIAATHGVPVATRETSPTVTMGLTIIDPWQPQA